MLQPVKIGCVWAADKDDSDDLKVLEQFTACLLETVPSEEEQTPKASKREKRDQHSECWLGAGAEGDQAPTCSEAQVGPGPRADVLGEWINNLKVLSVNHKGQRLLGTSVSSLISTIAVQRS